MTPCGDVFRPGSVPGRVTAFFFIAGAHVLLLTALTLVVGPKAVLQAAKPLFVQFVPAPLAPPPRVPPLRLPAMRAPQITLPAPPVIETLAVQLAEPSAPAPVASEPVAVVPAPAVAQAPRAPVPAVEPPRFDLAYLNNPPPPYPPLSRRLREQGRVVLRVMVGASGLVESIEVLTTSGFSRLDDTALAAVRRWRFVPARAGERAVAGWAIVPVAFHLDS